MLALYDGGQISRETLVKSYKESLDIVAEELEHLTDSLPGKTVVSADHGENLGERKFGFTLVGHTYDSEETRIVPWLELPCEERRQISEDPPIGFEYLTNQYVKDRLEDLGYMT